MKLPAENLFKRVCEISKARFCALIFSVPALLFAALVYGGAEAKEILSSDERAWLTNNQPRLVLAVETGYAPFVFLDEKNQPTGLAHDYISLIESKLGVHFNQRQFSSLDEIFQKVRSGEIHIVNAVTNTPARAKFLSMTDPFISVPNVIVVRKDRLGHLSEYDLQGLRVSLVKSYAVTEHMSNRGLHYIPDLVSNDLDALLNVSFGHSDAAVIDLATASYLISEKGIANLQVAGEMTYDIRLSIGTSEPVLHGILQKALNAVSDAERAEIKKRWINVSKSQSIFKDRQFWMILGSVLAISLGIFAIVLVWNNTLRRQIALRKQAEAALRSSGEMLKEAQHISQIGNWELDIVKGRLLWSDEIFNLLEVDPDKFQPTHEGFLNAVHPDDRDAVQQAYARSLKNHAPYEITHRLSMPDGRVKWVTERCNTYFDAAGKPVRSIATVQDITERRKAEEELQHYKTHLEEEVQSRTAELANANLQLFQTQFAMDKAGIGIHWIDDDGRFVYVNECAAQLLGYTQEQMRAMSVPDVDPNFAGKDFRVQTRALREMRSATFETSQRHKNGEIIPIEVTFYYQPGKEGNAGRFISFVTDIRLRKQAEQALRQAKEAAEAASHAKSVFLASMSHELRTPLNAILGFSSLLRRDAQLRPEQRTNLDIINRSGEHLLNLINDILEMSKIEAGKTQLNVAPFDLGALVRDVTDMMELRARAKGLQLVLDQASEFPRYILGDEARLRQILINLLGNAVKFTEQGGVTLRLGSRQNAISHLIIEVEDTGIGISAEDQRRLFQPFMQFGKLAGDNQGTGLGLSITHQFVQLMGGSIGVESTAGKGSLFRVSLPLSEVQEADQLTLRENSIDEVSGLAPGQPVYRILIVEDQRENQLLLSQLMQRLGFEIKVADNGAQGVQLFQSWHPQLIFMDRRMPDMDGITATKAIRQLPGGNAVKIVAVTASAFMDQRDEMLAAGMDDFVRKPYRFSEIYESLGRQLGVQYTYAVASGEPAVALTSEMLAVLPLTLRNELHDALISLDSRSISAVLDRVAVLDSTLHRALSGLVDNYDYPGILKALETGRAKAS